MRIWVIFTCVLVAALPAPGGETCTSTDRNAWVLAIVKEAETVKIGMTRADLKKVFVEEGGTAQRTHRTYVYRDCPYIKVDVEFSSSTQSAQEDSSAEDRNDVITRISTPYLGWSVID